MEAYEEILSNLEKKILFIFFKIFIIPDGTASFGKLDPDPHRREKQDPDPPQQETVEVFLETSTDPNPYRDSGS